MLVNSFLSKMKWFRLRRNSDIFYEKMLKCLNCQTKKTSSYFRRPPPIKFKTRKSKKNEKLFFLDKKKECKSAQRETLG